MRPHIEMQSIDLNQGWTRSEVLPEGLEVRILADDLSEESKTGARSRFVRFAPGAKTDVAFEHTYWEEVFLISGDMYPLDESQGGVSVAPVYTLRPPATPHGPFGSKNGCVLFEIQYYLK